MYRVFALFAAFSITTIAFGGGLYAHYVSDRISVAVQSGQSFEASLLRVISVPRIDTFFLSLRDRTMQFFFGEKSIHLEKRPTENASVSTIQIVSVKQFSDVYAGIAFPYPEEYIADTRFSFSSSSQIRFRDSDSVAEWWVRLMPNVGHFSWARGSSRYGTDEEGILRDVAGAVVARAGSTTDGNDFFELRASDGGTQFVEYAIPIFKRDIVVLIGTAWDERLRTLSQYTNAIENARAASRSAAFGFSASTTDVMQLPNESPMVRAPFIPASEKEKILEATSTQP